MNKLINKKYKKAIKAAVYSLLYSGDKNTIQKELVMACKEVDNGVTK